MGSSLWMEKLKELAVHHYNLSGALAREAAAKGMGLDAEPYRHPYPGSTNYTVNVVTPGEAKAEARATLDGTPGTTTTNITTAPPPGGNPASGSPGNPGQNGHKKRLWPWLAGGLGALGLAAGGTALVLNQSPVPVQKPGIVYEVYERDEGGGWKKSELTVDQLLGGKPLP